MTSVRTPLHGWFFLVKQYFEEWRAVHCVREGLRIWEELHKIEHMGLQEEVQRPL